MTKKRRHKPAVRFYGSKHFLEGFMYSMDHRQRYLSTQDHTGLSRNWNWICKLGHRNTAFSKWMIPWTPKDENHFSDPSHHCVSHADYRMHVIGEGIRLWISLGIGGAVAHMLIFIGTEIFIGAHMGRIKGVCLADGWHDEYQKTKSIQYSIIFMFRGKGVVYSQLVATILVM